MKKEKELSIDIQVIEKFKPLFTRDRIQYPYVVLVGGRNSTKSWAVGQYIIYRMLQDKVKVANCREVQKSIKDSTYSLLINTIDRFNANHLFDITNNDIKCKNGSESIFRGLKSHNINAIKSLEGIDVCVVEEAEAVSQVSWDKLIPTIRKEGSEIIVIFNPANELDPTYQTWITNPPRGTIVIESSYLDNPWISDKSLAEIEDLKEKDHSKYLHVYMGQPLGDDEDSIMKSEWFNACIDAHKVLGFEADGKHSVGFDPSDGGNDPSGLVERRGSVVTSVEEIKGKLLEEATRHAYSFCRANNVPTIVYDSIGVGAGCNGLFNLMDTDKKIKTIAGFKASSSASNKMYKDVHRGDKYFRNLRAEITFNLADRIYNTYVAVVHGKYIDPANMISFDSDTIDKETLKQLKYECINVREKRNSDKKQVESKEEMRKRGIASPNLFDGLCMAFHEVEDVSDISFESIDFGNLF